MTPGGPAPSGTSEDVAERLRRLPPEYAVRSTGTWLVATRAGGGSDAPQGWKLHVAARPSTLVRTLEAVLPVLTQERCDFKVVQDEVTLGALNHGLLGPGAVGKAVTVYPDQARVREVAERLVGAVDGFEAPRVPSDRQVRAGAPVYYRYGAFRPTWRVGDDGYLDVVVRGPDGSVWSAGAVDRYEVPPWVQDPFVDRTSDGVRLPRRDGAVVIGDHYRVEEALARTVRGGVFRATDLRSGASVVVKTAKAFVSESSAGDARSYLRHERDVLRRLAGVDRVPQLVDHFAYGPDEYLAATDVGREPLLDDVVERGVLTPEGTERSLLALGADLVEVLDSLHARGVVYRDLAPQNVVLTPDGRWGLVDFELSALDGVQRFGWTPAFAPAGQRANAPASPSDDWFALGAVLFYAAMGMDPVIVDDAPTLDVTRTTACLRAAYGDDAVATRLVVALLTRSGADDAVERLRARSTGPAAPAPPRPPESRGTARRPTPEALVASVRRGVVRSTEHALVAAEGGLPPPVVVQVGLSGAVAELARHPGSAGLAADAAHVVVQVLARADSPAGLLYGRMGAALAVGAAAGAVGDPGLAAEAARLVPGPDDLRATESLDVVHGVAGLGLGYLDLARRSPVAASLAAECAARLVGHADVLERQLASLPEGHPAHGTALAEAPAHGRSGVALFLLAYAARTGDEAALSRARELLAGLPDAVRVAAAAAEAPTARPMCASWCQGLSGMGTVLVRAARQLEDATFLDAACLAARGCLAVAPRIPLVGQCCGLAGIGELMIDLALATGDGTWWDAAGTVLGHVLDRAGGEAGEPRFEGGNAVVAVPGWGNGSPGVLSFVSRLADPSRARLWLGDDPAGGAAGPDRRAV